VKNGLDAFYEYLGDCDCNCFFTNGDSLMDFKTIGIGGQLCQGKDVFADYLVTRVNLRYADPNNMWTRNAFANLVKQIFQDTFGVNRDFIETWKRVPEPPPGFLLPVRDCLILIGDGFRKMKGNVWIENAFRNQTHHQIIADCRYVNETTAIRERDGVTILLWRPDFENNIQNASEQEYAPFIHKLKTLDFDGPIPAELEVPFDLWIRNNGTVEDLQRKIDDVVVPYIDNFWGFGLRS
jgi:hypothetical protein